jgi:hypothetical protein
MSKPGVYILDFKSIFTLKLEKHSEYWGDEKEEKILWLNSKP